ncbi:cytochrome-c peroxidase [Cognatishimia activa]|uniref:cytochrome-c peroxidase n=1 Tax=Cognatishimia activa TaxID=1715691 RepID=UPI0022300CDE|nr:cytochrome c peroxidase [Cognatishimia activa]UZD91375.1 c-type cytochrome [Cognatishimia activa]
MRYRAGILALSLSAVPSFAMEFGADPVFPIHDYDRVELGWLLFYDPILSGNRNISCATCHHPNLNTADGVALSLGEGGIGLGPERKADPNNLPEQRIPRNAPALFNLGATQFDVMFHDGRLEADASRPGGMRTPLGEDMVSGFDSVLSAQAMFPVLSADEMAGHYSENEISQAVRLGQLSGPDGAWDLISKRVRDFPEYRERFAKTIGADKQIAFTDIANALASFIAVEWRADDSRFDQFLAGSAELSPKERRGLVIFYSERNCASCHSGRFQTDHGFHAIGLPQFGPGKAARFENHNNDVGRGRVTGEAADFHKFRTPSLRNVTLTAPYGHNGAIPSLEAMIRHHGDAASSFAAFDRQQVILPSFSAVNDWAELENPNSKPDILLANELDADPFTDQEVDDLIAFLETLTDVSWRSEGLGVPESVPSGLPIDR